MTARPAARPKVPPESARSSAGSSTRGRAASSLGRAVAGPTRWGDREGRRRDILAAAREQVEGDGYLALNMRTIAAAAGVSPGTLYSYFATKEEIFATLYAQAIEAHNERIAPICARVGGLVPLLTDLTAAYVELYAAYGRHFTLWSALQAESTAADAPLPPELAQALRQATFEQGELVRAALVQAAAHDHLELVDETKGLTLLWAVLNGVSDHLTSDRRHLTPLGADELIGFTATTLAAGLTRPA